MKGWYLRSSKNRVDPLTYMYCTYPISMYYNSRSMKPREKNVFNLLYR